MITVIIPTANRPGLLRTALESVALQTALGRVSRVFVSENGGCRESKAVCAQFSALPIEYVYREPLPVLEHGRALLREFLHDELVAFLHDDDWWAPGHLTNALEAFAQRPQTSAYGACHFVVDGESSMLNCSGNLFPWFGANYPVFQPFWELSRMNILMAELLGSVSHYSSMVVRTTALRKASYVLDLNNPFDNDRMLIFALTTSGPILYNPVPEVFVRKHSIQDCMTFGRNARVKHMCNTTRWMVESSGKPWEVVADAFFRRMASCPREAVATLKMLSDEPWCVPEIIRHSPRSLNPFSPRPTLVEAAAA